MRTTSLLAGLVLSLSGIVVVTGQTPRVPAGPAPGLINPSDLPPLEDLSKQKQPAPITGLTDKLGLDGDKSIDELLDSKEFENPVAGISFRPPADSEKTAGTDQDNIVEYVNKRSNWLLKVTRAKLAQPMPLQTTEVPNPNAPVQREGKVELAKRIGLLDFSVDEFMKGHPAATIVRQDIINEGEYGVGLAIYRLDIGGERFLRQQAFFQVNEQLYYVFNLTTPSPKVANPENDPGERAAARTFMAMLDTIQLMDRTWIRTDQVNRLFRTRALFADWNGHDGKRIRDAIVPEQWLRIVRDGKDIGYSYQVEEFVEGRNVRNNPGRLRDGVQISVRTRIVAGNTQRDLGLQSFTSLDRKHEDWAQINNEVIKDDKGGEEKQQNMEFGYSEIHVTRMVDKQAERDPKLDPAKEKDRNLRDPRNPILKDVETVTLGVDRAAQGRSANNKPERHKPAAWYIPQGIGTMLPRLVPLNRPVTYLFQSYVSDQHACVMRYVDVGFEKVVEIGGKKVRAIPISDRIRLEGMPIVHYMSPEGQYLGSINEELKLQILPTDKATLEKLWQNADLTKPTVERPADGGVR